MIIVGIDPGTTRIGYGVIKKEKEPALITCGLLKIKAGEDNQRIKEGVQHFRQIIKKYKPDIVAFEKIFFVSNQKTAMAVAQMRGALILCAQEVNIPIAEYTPTEVKNIVAGFGHADKKSLAKMVAFSLRLKAIPGPDDVSDALAISLAAVYSHGKRWN